MIPIIPHFSNECLKKIKKNEKNFKWPNYDEKILLKMKNKFCVQINGKKRGLIKC